MNVSCTAPECLCKKKNNEQLSWNKFFSLWKNFLPRFLIFFSDFFVKFFKKKGLELVPAHVWTSVSAGKREIFQLWTNMWKNNKNFIEIMANFVSSFNSPESADYFARYAIPLKSDSEGIWFFFSWKNAANEWNNLLRQLNCWSWSGSFVTSCASRRAPRVGCRWPNLAADPWAIRRNKWIHFVFLENY